jgi:hypothetical protein
MSEKIKICVFFTTKERNSEDLVALYQLANNLADLELNLYQDFDKYSKLRILEFGYSLGKEVELWIYYGSIASRDSIPAIVLHQTEGIVLIGEESPQRFLLEYRKPVIWFKEKTGSQTERKGMRFLCVIRKKKK